MRYDPSRRPNAPQSGMGVRFTPNQLAEMHAASPQYSPSPQLQQQQQQLPPSNSSQPPSQVCSSRVDTWINRGGGISFSHHAKVHGVRYLRNP